MTEKKKTTRTRNSGKSASTGIVDQAQDVVREIAENVREAVEDVKDDVRAVAEELGLKRPEGPGDGEPGMVSSVPQSAYVVTQSASTSGDRPDDARYDAQAVETKWYEHWQSDPRLYAAEDANSARKKYYVLEMLPYPSGAL